MINTQPHCLHAGTTASFDYCSSGFGANYPSDERDSDEEDASLCLGNHNDDLVYRVLFQCPLTIADEGVMLHDQARLQVADFSPFTSRGAALLFLLANSPQPVVREEYIL